MSVWWLAVLLACREGDGPVAPPIGTEPVDTAAASPLTFDGPPPRNLLMISVDTMRKSELGFYGGAAHTDAIDAFLAGSVHLDDHVQCSSWTYASTSCTLMGRLHEDNGYMPALTVLQQPLPEGTRLLAGWLSDAGFFTMIHSPNSWLSEKWGNTAGNQLAVDLGSDALGASREARELLQAELAGRPGDPWALHLHFTEPHAAYDPPESYLAGIEELPPVPWDLSDREAHYDVNQGRRYQQLGPAMQAALQEHLLFRYRADLAWFDDKFATILEEYEAAGLLDDTLVVFWTDHGEAFWEHGHQTHAWDLYPEENDAVLAFWAKNLEPVAWTGPTMAIDMVPTLLDVFGLPIPEEVKGRILGQAFDDRVRYASVLARAGLVQMVRQGDDALYYWWETGRVELYDLRADPGATSDEFAIGDPRVVPMWDAMAPYRATLDELLDAERVTPVGLPR